MKLMHIRQADSTTIILVPETSMEENLLARIDPRVYISTTVCEVVASGALKPVAGLQVHFHDSTEIQGTPPTPEPQI